MFTTLHHLPDPVPGDDGHFLPFDETFGKQTTEEHLPSLKQKKSTLQCKQAACQKCGHDATGRRVWALETALLKIETK